MSSENQPITTWLVTGASRGIGLELVRQLLESPNNVVVATCRTPEKSAALYALKDTARGTLHVVRLDVSDFAQIRAASKELEAILGETGLDFLINNAGVANWLDSAFTLEAEDLMNTLRTNVAGPALIAQVCLPFLEKGRRKTILNVSSIGASLSSVPTVGAKLAAYALSKAALNMLTQKQKVERPDFIVICLDPGWVKTDMGGEGAQLEPRESVSGILKVLTTATPVDSGKYVHYNGEEIPW